jgi:oligopeptide/dipeptide ABC transporter ATP-binding protein
MSDVATPSTGPLLEVKNLVKHYPTRSGAFGRTKGAVRAVDGVSLSLMPGETLGLVGESGCGKSTLVKTLLWLERPTSGEIRFRGQPLDQAHAHAMRRDIQIVFQDPYQSLPPRMTIGEIVADPMRIHKLGDKATIERRVRQLLQEVGLNPDRAGQYPFQFSGGQRQRVGIARALAVEPSLLLLDESVSALDVSVQAQVLNLLRDLQERHNLTYIFISHDLSVVRHMSDRIAVMYLGRIVEQGPAAQVYDQPLHPYTRALLSAAPSLTKGRRERIRLQGEPPKPTAPPSGCPFHPRCPMARERCSVDVPMLHEWLPGRLAACHYALETSNGANAANAAMASAVGAAESRGTIGDVA